MKHLFIKHSLGNTTLTVSVASEFQKPRYMCRKKVKEKSVNSRKDKQLISRRSIFLVTDLILISLIIQVNTVV